ncbi:MAG: glucose-6-phosphate isomerase [Coriobacteriia bacterium]|nr:glucose-6-phosphate isomerase [Coriobacteriia bacterium]
MSQNNNEQYTCCADVLLAKQAPSRLHSKDTSLFAEIANEAQIRRCLGWADLASDPPIELEEIAAIAGGIRLEGLDAVVLIGQGGSSQASMTISKLYEISKKSDIAFRTMDSLSPVTVNRILHASDPARTLYIVSSKSGSTIEPLMLERVAWQYVTGHLGSKGAAKRFVAITDPGSKLEQLALVKDYRFVFSSPVDVGGRFSALSIFALFPASCMGIDIEQVVSSAAAMELRCAEDSKDNPALDLACFIYQNYRQGRDKISLVMPRSGAVFGLWLEQLIAESLGKQDLGILPYVEVDASILHVPHEDKLIITYTLGYLEGFEESLYHLDPTIPVRHYRLNSADELFARFVVWEYAVAMLGLLMEINPFDQPDVEDTKKRVRSLLANRESASQETSTPEAQPVLPNETQKTDYLEIGFLETDYIRCMRISNALMKQAGLTPGDITIDQALRALFGTLESGDYFSLNAFLPFKGYGRREPMERMRNWVTSRLGVASCLEIGPRYLHSTGQLHKGGPNTGVFCFLSADETEDIAIPGEEFTLGTLAATQAEGDYQALAARDRRAIQIHLANNDAKTLSRFADRFCLAVSSTKRPE